jgi:hypothetical protein
MPKPTMKPTQLLLALCGLLATPAALVAQNEPPRPDQPPPPGRSLPAEARREAPVPPKREPGRPERAEPGPRPEARREAPVPPKDEHRSHARDGDAHAQGRATEMRPVSYLGVLTAPVSPEVRAHLGLREGFGLRIVEVQRGSPAQAAGLKENDILIRFEDQRLASMEQLQALVRECHKGEMVNLLLISAGKEAMVSVEVGEVRVPLHPEPQGPRFMPPPDLQRPPGAHFGEMREAWERHRRALQEWQEGLRHGGRGDMPPAAPRGRAPADQGAGESRRGEGASVSTVTRSDDSGIYTLKREGDRVVFSVQPKDGEVRSWNLPQEHDRIPEPLRDKLRQLEEIRGDRAEGRNRSPAESRNPEKDPRDRR